MIFSNPNLNQKLKEILKRKYGYTDDMLIFIEQSHMSAMVSIVLEEAASYFEENEKEEELEELHSIVSRVNDMKRLSPQDIQAAYRMMEINFQAYDKYPELAEKIDQRMEAIRQDMLKEIFDRLDEEEAIEFLEAVKEEVERFAKISETISEK